MKNFKGMKIELTPHDYGGTLPSHVTLSVSTEVNGVKMVSQGILPLDDLESVFDLFLRDIGERLKFEIRKYRSFVRR